MLKIVLRLLNLQDAPSSTRRLASVLSLLLLVIFFAPYQFAFLVLTLLCLLVTQPSNPYHFTILLLWLLAVPIKGPILMVWIRNLGAGWWAPFSSDHNIFPFLGFLLWYEAAHASHQGGQQLPIQHEQYVHFCISPAVYLTFAAQLSRRSTAAVWYGSNSWLDAVIWSQVCLPHTSLGQCAAVVSGGFALARGTIAVLG